MQNSRVLLGVDWGNNYTCLAARIEGREPQVHVPQASSVVRLKLAPHGIDVVVPDRRLHTLQPDTDLAQPSADLADLKHIIRCIADPTCELPCPPGLQLQRVLVDTESGIQTPDIAISFTDDEQQLRTYATHIMQTYWKSFIHYQFHTKLSRWATVSGIMVTIPASTPQPVINIYRQVVHACWPDLPAEALHFVVESEAALFKWVQDGHANDLRRLNKSKVMVIDIGDSTLDICLMGCQVDAVSGRFIATTLVSQCSHRLVGRTYSRATMAALQAKIIEDLKLFRRHAEFKHEFNADDAHRIKESLSELPYPAQPPQPSEAFFLTNLLSAEFNQHLEEFQTRYGSKENTFLEQVYNLRYVYDEYQALHRELIAYLDQFMRLPKCSPIHHVLITGGAAMTWGLQDALRISFNRRTNMVLPTVSCKKDHVALGALWSKDPRMDLRSVTNVDLGVAFEYNGSSTLHVHKLLSAGMPLPAVAQSTKALYTREVTGRRTLVQVVEGHFEDGDEYDATVHHMYNVWAELDDESLARCKKTVKIDKLPPLAAQFSFSPNFMLTVQVTAGQTSTRKQVLVQQAGQAGDGEATGAGGSQQGDDEHDDDDDDEGRLEYSELDELGGGVPEAAAAALLAIQAGDPAAVASLQLRAPRQGAAKPAAAPGVQADAEEAGAEAGPATRMSLRQRKRPLETAAAQQAPAKVAAHAPAAQQAPAKAAAQAAVPAQQQPPLQQVPVNVKATAPPAASRAAPAARKVPVKRELTPPIAAEPIKKAPAPSPSPARPTVLPSGEPVRRSSRLQS